MKEFIKKLIPRFFISWHHLGLVFLAGAIYRFPSKKLKVIGVTGTNGKSTVSELITKILEEAGHKVAVLNSIRFKIGEKELPNELRMTMPGRFFIQRFLRRAVNSGCQYAVLEVTSEGIKQYRHKFIAFEAAVLTNLTPEHIEAHGGFENYKKTKGKLFQATEGIHIINIDDKNADYFLQFPAKMKYLYKIKNQNSKFKKTNQNSKLIGAEGYQVLPDGLKFLIDNTEFRLRLLGEFNIYNSLAAICVALSQGVSLEICKGALEKVAGIPGRMELVIAEPFKAFVDYAFTPNALSKVYETLLNSKLKIQNSKLICVLGACGGGRDKWKRPVLGEIAAEHCEEVILTNEDPYDEDPDQILESIEKGILKIKKLNKNLKFKIKNYQKILDRKEAIRRALNLAKQGDIVIITGKGCEPCICAAGGKRIPWDDRRVVKEEFQQLKSV